MTRVSNKNIKISRKIHLSIEPSVVNVSANGHKRRSILSAMLHTRTPSQGVNAVSFELYDCTATAVYPGGGWSNIDAMPTRTKNATFQKLENKVMKKNHSLATMDLRPQQRLMLSSGLYHV